MTIRTRIPGIFSLLLWACASKAPTATAPTPAPTPEAPLPEADVRLTQEQAALRARYIRDARYRLRVELGAESPDFRGEVEMSFTVSERPREELFLDFQRGRVESLTINGQLVPAPEHAEGRVILPGLQVGENRVKLAYAAPYSKEGNGLYRFRDPEDGQHYLYTDFEPFDASRFLPCFDQPDLKGRFTLEVEAPAGWEVISTMRESALRAAGANRVVWTFPETAALSTYVFSLHAGPYKRWSSMAGKVPLRLFVRRSLAKYVRPEEWFDVTRKGFAYFEAYFDYAYPFGKYDQIIVPDFNSGAMENVGAVTFSERYVSRGVKTAAEREGQASTILHELAHMWFGNLVTMKWWNDLWLNESFATYLATKALVEATEFREAWMSFYTDDKAWGYWEDRLVTTHPIEAPVPDTAQAFANFDGITYAKGASALKQLDFYAGPEKFRDGIRAYFKRFAFGNAERRDFVGAVATAAGLKLDEWSRLWLERAGVDTLRPVFACENGRLTRFALEQGLPEGEREYRPHRTLLSFYASDVSGYRVSKEIPVGYGAAVTELSELKGEVCPHLVNPNAGDHDYVITKLDLVTTANLEQALPRVRDPLSRVMFWTALYEMMRSAELAPERYGRWVLAALKGETNPYILDHLLTALEGGRFEAGNVLLYFPKEVDEPRLYFLREVETTLWDLANAAPRGSDRQKMFADSYVRAVETRAGVARLRNWLRGSGPFALDQDRRWHVIAKLCELGHHEAEALLAAERKRDTSERGLQSAFFAEAALPNPAKKEAFFRQVTGEGESMSHSRKKSILRGLYPSTQESFRRGNAERFYATLKELAGKRPDLFLDVFADNLVPLTCDEASGERLAKFLAENPDLPVSVLKSLRVSHQENGRCVAIRRVR